jgi:hypothetical protein
MRGNHYHGVVKFDGNVNDHRCSVCQAGKFQSFAPEVQTAGDGHEWSGNGLRFATREEAEANVSNLMGRWMAVTATRVVESSDPVT